MIQKVKFSASYISALMFCGVLYSTPKAIELDEAIKQNLVHFSAEAVHADDRTKLAISIKNITSHNLEIYSKSGLQLEPEDPEFQNMLLIEPVIVNLRGQEEQDLIITGYCTEVNDRFPMEQLVYRLASQTDADLASLGDYIYTRPELRSHDEVIQSAVWTVSDRSDLGAIYDDDSQAVTDLRTYCSDLTGLEDVWYNMDVDYSVDEEGILVSEPMEISGELSLDSPVAMSVRSYLVNEDGEEIWSSSNTLEVPKGSVEISFQLRVENWPTGTYTVYYKSETETLLAQDFTL